jgi:hypothetical protein
VVRYNQGPRKFLRPAQRRLQEIQLRVADFRRSYNTGVFQHVGIKGDDAQQRRLEGEEHAGLDLRRARQAASLRRDTKSVAQKLSRKAASVETFVPGATIPS